MKILYIITQADGGGAQKYVLALAKHFDGVIAAGDEASKLFDEAKRAGLAVYPLQHLKRNIHPWHDLLAIYEIQRLVKILKPDTVHLNSTKAGFLGSVGAKLAGAKVVFTAHGFRYLEPLSHSARAFYLAIEKLAGDFRDFIITVSGFDKKSALANNLIKPDKISTIHNGIPQIDFLTKEKARSILGLPLFSKEGGGSYNFIFGTVANFYKTKGLDVLIDAVSLLPLGEGPGMRIKDDVLFVIIGNGQDFENCKLKIKNLGLESNFKLLGQVPEARTVLKAFDAFILPSRKEGFPFAILEASQAGLPIIATNVGGIPEALGDAGILIEPKNPHALKEAIEKLYEDAQLRKVLSQKALERSKLFTEEKMFEQTKKVYESLMKN